MADLYLNISDQPEDVLEAIATAMNTRAADPVMQAICADYMGRLPGPGKDVLEIGCGNGATTELIVRNLKPARLVGVDPSPGLLDRARDRYPAEGISFGVGDAVATGQPDASFDVVVVHTVFSHLDDPEAALAEAFRVLRPGGTLAVFDGDYATNTVALYEGDPLQAAMKVVQDTYIHDPYVMRRLSPMAAAAGFSGAVLRPHGYVQTSDADYMLSLVSRGVSAAARAGDIGDALADGFIAEARRRIEAGTFYGAILFASMTALKPG